MIEPAKASSIFERTAKNQIAQDEIDRQRDCNGFAQQRERGLVSNTPLIGGGAPRPALVHYMTETEALVFYYLKLFAAPFGQSIDREYALVSSAGDVWFLVSVLMLAAALVVVIVLRRHRNLGQIGRAAFVLYRRNLLLFAAIGATFVALGTLASAVQGPPPMKTARTMDEPVSGR